MALLNISRLEPQHTAREFRPLKRHLGKCGVVYFRRCVDLAHQLVTVLRPGNVAQFRTTKAGVAPQGSSPVWRNTLNSLGREVQASGQLFVSRDSPGHDTLRTFRFYAIAKKPL